jgi:hypothetical protein
MRKWKLLLSKMKNLLLMNAKLVMRPPNWMKIQSLQMRFIFGISIWKKYFSKIEFKNGRRPPKTRANIGHWK